MFLKVIACEIAVRELYFAASRSPNLVDLEFLTQGYHDIPGTGRQVGGTPEMRSRSRMMRS